MGQSNYYEGLGAKTNRESCTGGIKGGRGEHLHLGKVALVPYAACKLHLVRPAIHSLITHLPNSGGWPLRPELALTPSELNC